MMIDASTTMDDAHCMNSYSQNWMKGKKVSDIRASNPKDQELFQADELEQVHYLMYQCTFRLFNEDF